MINWKLVRGGVVSEALDPLGEAKDADMIEVPDTHLSAEEIELAKAKAEAELAIAKAKAQTAITEAEAQARLAEVQAKAKEASVKAELELKTARRKAKAKVSEERSKQRKKIAGRIFRFLGVKGVLIILAVAAVISIGGYVGWSSTRPSETLTSAQISKVVAINELAVVDFNYEGIAIYKGDGHKKDPLHIYYKAQFKASFNPGDITYAVDDKAKVVIPTLPEMTISDPNVDDRIDCLERDAQNINQASVLTACKEDAISEVKKKADIKSLATGNARKVVEGLSMNLLESKGYKIVWPEDKPENTNVSEGDTNAA